MKTSRRPSRRSFLAAVTGTGSLLLMPGAAGAQGCSDTDSGAGADPGGQGRRCASRPQTGVTDRDSGPNADPAGRGRNTLPEMHGGEPSTWTTDQDPTDPAGRGRGAYGLRRSGVTDSDRGPNADQAGNGRGEVAPSPAEQRQIERGDSCARLVVRRDELRRQLIQPEYWGPDERAEAERDAAYIESAFARDDDEYVSGGSYQSIMSSIENTAASYGLRCENTHCTNVSYELRMRAARAGGSWNTGEYRAMVDELGRLQDSIERNCPSAPR